MCSLKSNLVEQKKMKAKINQEFSQNVKVKTICRKCQGLKTNKVKINRQATEKTSRTHCRKLIRLQVSGHILQASNKCTSNTATKSQLNTRSKHTHHFNGHFQGKPGSVCCRFDSQFPVIIILSVLTEQAETLHIPF